MTSVATAELIGPLQLVTAPSGYVVTLDEAKQHCRVESGFTDDNVYLTNLIATATRYVEHEIYGARQLLSATYDLPVADWWYDSLELPRPPLSSVTSVKYYDTSGTQQTLDSSNYSVTTSLRQPGWIDQSVAGTWPSYQIGRSYPITVRFVAGYGAGVAITATAGASSVPATIRHAILLVIGELYNNREAGLLGVAAGGTSITSTLLAVRWMLESEGWGSYR